jgi:hypothetical protein
MPIVGPRPESGIRVDVERPLSTDGGPPWRYAGHVATPDASFALDATVGEDGSVEVSLPPEAPAGLDEKVRLLLRAAFKHAQGGAPPPGDAGRDRPRPPPRRVVRWRPEG